MAAVQTINRWLRAEARGNLNHRVFSPAFGAFITLHAWQYGRSRCHFDRPCGKGAGRASDQEPPAAHELGVHEDRHGNGARRVSLPQCRLRWSATYFSGIRRAVSEEIADLEAKRVMLGIADDYERLAQRAEERAARLIPLK